MVLADRAVVARPLHGAYVPDREPTPRPSRREAMELRAERGSAHFEKVFEAHHRRVLGYAVRRTASEQDAEDVVAETFAVAWRRLSDLPGGEAAFPWLLAVARRVAANQNRGAGRRLRLWERLRAHRAPVSAASSEETPAGEALAQLSPDDQELLRLLAWDGLNQTEAGVALGISANAVAIRLHRARKRFAAALAKIEADDLKGSDHSRTSLPMKGRLPGQAPGERQA